MIPGFSFKGRSLADFPEVYMKSDNRTVRPAVRKLEVTVPGRDGVLDFGDDGYDTRTVSVVLSVKSSSLAVLRRTVRDLAYWLSGSGSLIFDDESDKMYSAQVISQIDLEQITATGRCGVAFRCQPFAEAIDYDRVIATVTQNGREILLNNAGTQRTPCVITITNTGPGDISGIVLTRLSVG